MKERGINIARHTYTTTRRTYRDIKSIKLPYVSHFSNMFLVKSSTLIVFKLPKTWDPSLEWKINTWLAKPVAEFTELKLVGRLNDLNFMVRVGEKKL